LFFYRFDVKIEEMKYNKLHINLIISIFILIFIYACGKKTIENPINDITISNDSYLIVNEGNYNWNNASISLYNLDSNRITNNVFYKANNTKLGDVAQSALITENEIYLVINNSGSLKKLSKNNFQQMSEIKGFISPRFMVKKENKAYLSDLYAGKISVLDLENFTLINEIKAPKSTENMLLYNDKLFVLNWSFGNKLLVIDTQNDIISDSLKLTTEPNSILLDKNNNLWVLCGGGFNSTENPALYEIEPEKLTILNKLGFANKSDSPNHLCTNNTKDSLFFINENIYKMGIADALPETKFLNALNRNFYGLFIDENNDIWVSDVKDFVKNSEVYIYSQSGKELQKFTAGANTSRIYKL